ncbi:uncharacterized protein ACBR49_001003 [Aulostomus maculatus]
MMASSLSCLSSLKEDNSPVYVQPHYRESYRLAIYALLCGGTEAYEEFLRAEQISHLLSEDEIFFILDNAEVPVVEDGCEGQRVTEDHSPSTYFPTESDEEVPDLDLGWPVVALEEMDTSISLLFHPPRQNTPTIKEVVRKQIQEAKQVIAMAMDIFTDVDIFKEIISATLRGVAVYILLDEAQFRSFHIMSLRVGVNVQELKNIRVRTVQGQQYQCQSGVKFHGGLEQKFLLVDCRTVLYGTYSYAWSFEKINLSMVLVITGQLVCSYDEEFRRLYARSTVPVVLSKERSSLRYSVALHSPSSSQLCLHHIHMRSRGLHGMRGAPEDRFPSAAMMTKGLSMQEKLHQCHCPDMGNLVRGHSYGGELQNLNSMTRLRMGTKDIPERTNLRGGGDTPLPNRLSQQHFRHRTRYGPDQNLIPFNSETSLHRWKIDAYLNDSDVPLDASCDALSPVISPYSSHTGLNEHQSQMIHSRSRDIKARLEELRLKRLSLQEYSSLRHSQESLRSTYPALERPKLLSSLRSVDIRLSVAEVETDTQDDYCLEANNQDSETNEEGQKKEQNLADGNHSASYSDIQTGPHHTTALMYDRHESADTTVKLNLASSSLTVQHPRTMESLTKIPEEKEGSNTCVNNLDSTALKEGYEEKYKDKKSLPKVNSSMPAEPQHPNVARGSHSSSSKMAKGSGSGPSKEAKKPLCSEAELVPKILNTPESSKAENSLTEKQRDEPALQRKNSMRLRVHSSLTADEKKAGKKEEKSLQRKPSVKSQSASGSNSRAEQTGTQSISKSQVSVSGSSETEKHKSPFTLHRLSSQRSSKRKSNPAAELDHSSRSNLDDGGTTAFQTRREQAYSRYEYLLSTKHLHLDKSGRTASLQPPDKDKSSSLTRHDPGYPAYHTQTSTDNKLGRFMQRVGNLIGKNK